MSFKKLFHVQSRKFYTCQNLFYTNISAASSTNITYVQTFSSECFQEIRVYAELHLRPHASNPQLQQVYKSLSEQNLWTCKEDLHEKWTKKFCNGLLGLWKNTFALAKEDSIKSVRRTFWVIWWNILVWIWKTWQIDASALPVIIFLW